MNPERTPRSARWSARVKYPRVYTYTYLSKVSISLTLAPLAVLYSVVTYPIRSWHVYFIYTQALSPRRTGAATLVIVPHARVLR